MWSLFAKSGAYRLFVFTTNFLGMVNIALLMSVFIVTTGEIHRPGRHICTQQKIQQRPIRISQSYCRPAYQRVFGPCNSDPRTICSSFRLTYRIEFRHIIRLIPQPRHSFDCCPGWTGFSVQQNGCMEPICPGGCDHGGQCVLPGRCNCPKGWSGQHCHLDVDECSSGLHDCQQDCRNVPGGYDCACQDGFILSTDGKTCTFCVSCTPEFGELMNFHHQMEQKVATLQEENKRLHSDVENLTLQLLNVTNYVSLQMTRSTVPTVEPTSRRVPTIQTPPFDQYRSYNMTKMEAAIQSLSRQLAGFEEKLERCSCTDGLGKEDFQIPSPIPIKLEQHEDVWDYYGELPPAS